MYVNTGFVQVMENMESHLSFQFPGQTVWENNSMCGT